MALPVNSPLRASARGQSSNAPSVLPEFAHDLLVRALGGQPGCLYQTGPDGVVHPVVPLGLEPDPRDPWSDELKTLRAWQAVPDDRTVPLQSLEARPGLSPPDPSLRLLALRADGAFLGGLLLRVTNPRDLAAVHRRLADPVLLSGLTAVLAQVLMRRDLEDLGGFREAVATALPYGVLVIDPLGRVTYASARALSILGVNESEAIGSDCVRVFRPVGPGANPLLDGLHGRFHSGEIYLVRPNGEEVPVLLKMALLPGRGRRGRSLAVLFQDLSEERVLEEIERQRDRLAALGELSAGVAHEIRNPLTGIANCAQVLGEGMEDSDPRQRFLRIILDETARLNRIVEGLLRYARPSRPELRESSLEEIVRNAIDLLRPNLDGKGVRLSYRLTGRVPRVFIDAGQIEQVLLNLLRNAEEAMPTGGEIVVSLSVVRRRPHRRRGLGRRTTDRARVRSGEEGPRLRFVQIKVADTGHGIPKELLSRIFNPFFSTRSKGTGLGLSLSQSIVREHGGFLSVRSVVNKGTVFHLDLPVERRHGERRKDQRHA